MTTRKTSPSLSTGPRRACPRATSLSIRLLPSGSQLAFLQVPTSSTRSPIAKLTGTNPRVPSSRVVPPRQRKGLSSMSQQQTNPSPADIDRLKQENYVVDLREGYLLVSDIPYVTSKCEIRRGVLICPSARSSDGVRPNDHVARWAGEHPCHHDGSKLTKIENSSNRERLFGDVYVDHTFSAKPKGRTVENYDDFHDKVTSYVAMISGPAEFLEPGITARTHRVLAPGVGSIFEYDD